MLALYIASVLATATAADPLAPAWAGQVQCYAPDLALRQCSSIGAYRRAPDGKILNEAIVGVSNSPSIMMTTVAEVQIKQDQICGVIGPKDVEGSTFSVEGAPATAEQTAILRQAMTAAMQPLFGHEVCVSATGQARLDGAPAPQMDQPVRWVPANAGYTVRAP